MSIKLDDLYSDGDDLLDLIMHKSVCLKRSEPTSLQEVLLFISLLALVDKPPHLNYLQVAIENSTQE